MKSQNKRAIAILILCATAVSQTSAPAMARFVTVEELNDTIGKGAGGSALATSYIQGLVDGMVTMESMRRNGHIREKEFCGLVDPEAKGSERHPAFETAQIVTAWKDAGFPMDTIAPDMMLSYLSKQYGC